MTRKRYLPAAASTPPASPGAIKRPAGAADYFLDEHGQDWDPDLCDATLIVEGLPLAVHSCVIAKWSSSLSGCFAAATEAAESSLQRAEIPLNDSFEAVCDVLKLIYKSAADSSLDELMQQPMARQHAAIRVVDKYNMPVLMHRLDRYLHQIATTPTSLDSFWPSVQQAILWTELSSAVQLSSLLEVCIGYVAWHVDRRDFAALATTLPMDTALRILQKMIAFAVEQNRMGRGTMACGLCDNLIEVAQGKHRPPC